LYQLRNCHAGRRGFILGAGPSMKIEYFDLLQNEITFAFNKIYRLFDRITWRPTYYMIIDKEIATEIKEELLDSEIETIYAGDNTRSVFLNSEKVVYFRRKYLKSTGDVPGFEGELRKGPLHACYTVTYDAFQLAWFMGIREFYTLGIDANYKIGDIKDSSNIHGHLTVAKADPGDSYFDPDLFRQGETMVLPRVDMQMRAYICARNFIERNGGVVYNAATESPLEIFPKKSLHSVLNHSGV